MTRIQALCAFLLVSLSSSAQVVSINPAVSNPSQTLTTAITLASGVIEVSTSSTSNPNQTSDIYLLQGGDTIYCNYFDATQIYPGPGGNSDSLYCDFTIPSNATLGWYEVHVTTHSPSPVDHLLTYGLVVADPNSCPVPFNTSATAITNVGAQINWDPAVLADTFRVRYRILGGSTYLYKDVDGAGAVVNTLLAGLNPSTNYTFEVSTKCTGYSSTYSIIDTFQTTAVVTPCIIPFALDTSAVTNTALTVSWSSFVSADSFLVRYSLNGTSNYSYKYVVGGGSNSTGITGLLPARTYQFQVTSICLAVSSGYSTSFVFNTKGSCVKPHSLSASAASTSALIGWTPLVSGDNFRIRYKINGASFYHYKTVAGTSDTATITGLNPATTYDYQVSTVCSGFGTGYSSVASFTTTSTAVNCLIPFGISVSAFTSSSVQINWSIYIVADTFRIRYRLNGAGPFFYKTVSGSGGVTNAILTGLLPNSLYTYQVSSICLGISSGYTLEGNFITSAGTVACVTPYNLGATAILANSASISWTPDVTADSFMVRYSVFGTTNYSWKKISGAGGVSSTSLTGLTNNTDYQFQVRSICTGVPISMYSTSYPFSTPLVRMSKPAQTSLEMQIMVSPNPSNGKFDLRFTATTDENCIFYLIDVAGRVLLKEHFTCMSGENLKEIQTQGIKRGIYTGILESGTQKKQLQILIR